MGESYGPTRESMQKDVDLGYATWIDDDTTQYVRYIDVKGKMINEPGAIIRLRHDLPGLPAVNEGDGMEESKEANQEAPGGSEREP